MNVFKFGGASIKDANAIKNVCRIIREHGNVPLLVVISASGKTTNALEEVASAYFDQAGNAIQKASLVRQHHLDICAELFEAGHAVYDDLQDLFVSLEWQLEEARMESYNYIYDQIVSMGELLSTTIVSHYLRDGGTDNHWLDVRDVLKTDDTYREAVVDWEQTSKQVGRIVPPLLKQKIVVTQGFLGCTSENCTTTLGREGSDYTAAIFANLLDAESQTVWKDVPGILNGDPRVWEDTELIEDMTYHEAIEMTFYGAQVIHPKTIKPLQNKQIPLLVRSFIDPVARGTKIYRSVREPIYPAIRVIKRDQALINLHTKDFSFIEEWVMSKIIKAFSKVNLKINMMQNAAILFQAVVDRNDAKIDTLTADLERFFNIHIDRSLTLLTVRHYNEEVIARARGSRKPILEQKRESTYQVLMK